MPDDQKVHALHGTPDQKAAFIQALISSGWRVVTQTESTVVVSRPRTQEGRRQLRG